MDSDILDRKKTALVIIDLQKGIVSMPAKPYSTAEVVKNASRLAKKFRESNMPVFLVHVYSDVETSLHPLNDSGQLRRGDMPEDWHEFVPELERSRNDIIITKKQWGAFYGTDLDLQLRRRKIDTIVLCGIATKYGVESTARFAYEYGYQQVFPEDAMSDLSEESHKDSVEFVLKRIGRVRKTEEILKWIR
jgi:nicotinamidase-related amidase